MDIQAESGGRVRSAVTILIDTQVHLEVPVADFDIALPGKMHLEEDERYVD